MGRARIYIYMCVYVSYLEKNSKTTATKKLDMPFMRIFPLILAILRRFQPLCVVFGRLTMATSCQDVCVCVCVYIQLYAYVYIHITKNLWWRCLNTLKYLQRSGADYCNGRTDKLFSRGRFADECFLPPISPINQLLYPSFHPSIHPLYLYSIYPSSIHIDIPLHFYLSNYVSVCLSVYHI